MFRKQTIWATSSLTSNRGRCRGPTGLRTTAGGKNYDAYHYVVENDDAHPYDYVVKNDDAYHYDYVVKNDDVHHMIMLCRIMMHIIMILFFKNADAYSQDYVVKMKLSSKSIKKR